MSDIASNQIAVETSDQYILLDSYDSVVRNITDLISDVRNSFFKIGCFLSVARSKRLYDLDSCVDVYDWGEKKFGIGKTTVKNLISVYENFKDSNGRLQEQFRDCSVSTLVELLPIIAEIRVNILRLLEVGLSVLGISGFAVVLRKELDAFLHKKSGGP
jgi:hypothetical protein